MPGGVGDSCGGLPARLFVTMIDIPTTGTNENEVDAMSTNDPDALLPLTPLTLQILVSLGTEPLHGYAVVKDVREATEGRINPGTGTFYSAIHRMRDEGLIEEVDERIGGDSRRRYYALTDFGRAVLEAEAQRLGRVVARARATLRT